MDKTLLPVWQKLNERTENIFKQLEKYPEDVLQKQPSANVWSVSQNVVHLIKAERASLEYMQKKLSYENSIFEKAGWRGSLRFLAVKTISTFPAIKFKAPSYIEPIAVKDLPDLKKDWANLRSEFEIFFKSLSSEQLHSELWKHAFAGKMSVRQMLAFFIIHVDRHTRQIERTLKQLKVES